VKLRIIETGLEYGKYVCEIEGTARLLIRGTDARRIYIYIYIFGDLEKNKCPHTYGNHNLKDNWKMNGWNPI